MDLLRRTASCNPMTMKDINLMRILVICILQLIIGFKAFAQTEAKDPAMPSVQNQAPQPEDGDGDDDDSDEVQKPAENKEVEQKPPAAVPQYSTSALFQKITKLLSSGSPDLAALK